jgi:hypothetical protein
MIGETGVASCVSGYGKIAAYYGRRGKLSSVMKRGEFPDYIRKCWLLNTLRTGSF